MTRPPFVITFSRFLKKVLHLTSLVVIEASRHGPDDYFRIYKAGRADDLLDDILASFSPSRRAPGVAEVYIV